MIAEHIHETKRYGWVRRKKSGELIVCANVCSQRQFSVLNMMRNLNVLEAIVLAPSRARDRPPGRFIYPHNPLFEKVHFAQCSRVLAAILQLYRAIWRYVVRGCGR